MRFMENHRCCPTDLDLRKDWENELRKDSDSLKNANIDETAVLFKVMSNPSRLKMVMLLSKRDYCVCELVNILDEKQNLISYNLGILKKHQLIESYYKSKDKYYKLNERAIGIIRCLKQNLTIGF